jgi:xylulokinase
MPLVLGVDSSARATKVELRDSDDGKVFGAGRAEHPVASPPCAEQDPAAWWQALVEARHDAGGALGVSAVAVAAQTQGLVVLDADGRVIRPAKLAHDTEAAPDAEGLVDALGGPAQWAQACGSVLDASFTIAKLAWLRRVEPDAYSRIDKVLVPHDWLTYRLSRQFVTDRGDASGTGYWLPQEDAWAPELLSFVDFDRDWAACLPRVLGPAEPAGDREGVVISAGTGEAMAAALGLGVRPRDVVINAGEVATIFTVRERPTCDETGTVAGLADATGRFLPLVRTPLSMNLIDSFARLLDVDATRFDQLALSGPPGAGGMALVPDAGGTRRLLARIPNDVSPELVARAVVEGVAMSILDAVDALRAADVPVGGRMILIGEGARGHAFQQVLADLSERPIAIPKGDRVATGACVQAACALHDVDAEQIARTWDLDRARELEPDPRVDADEIRAAHREARAARG